MKNSSVSLCLLSATLFAVPAFAQGEPRAGAPTPPPPDGEHRPLREEMLKRFDANHGGKLDENERNGLHDAWQEFLKQRPVLAAPAAPAGK